MHPAGCSSTRISGGNPSLSLYVSCLVNCAHCEVCRVSQEGTGAWRTHTVLMTATTNRSADAALTHVWRVPDRFRWLHINSALYWDFTQRGTLVYRRFSTSSALSSSVKQSKTGHGYQYNMAYAHCVLDNATDKLRICDSCFSTTTMVVRTRLSVMFVHALPVWLFTGRSLLVCLRVSR
jgi:hypothetical protein